MNDLSLSSSHKPEYKPHTIGHVQERGRGRMVPDNRYTLTCRCGFADSELRTKKQQREIYKAHLLATVGKY
jgi:hypothetical protein